MKTALLITALSGFVLHVMADAPKPGIRTMRSPDFDKLYPPSGEPWSNRAFFMDAIRDATKQLVPRLNSAESIIIYSIAPERVDDSSNGRTDRNHFHGYKILGSKTLGRDADLTSWRKELIEGLRMGNAVMCFEPRHAIRIHTRHTTTDMVLCFECGQMLIYGLGPGLRSRSYFFDREVHDALNQFLDASGIKRNTPNR